MSLPHNKSYHPPMPVLTVRFSATGQQRWLGPYEAIVDTGADATILPAETAKQLGAKAFDDSQIRSPWGEVHSVLRYIIDVEVEGYVLPGVVVAGDSYLEEFVLGRTLLNKLALFVDGPGRLTAVLDDATARRLRARYNPDK